MILSDLITHVKQRLACPGIGFMETPVIHLSPRIVEEIIDRLEELEELNRKNSFKTDSRAWGDFESPIE